MVVKHPLILWSQRSSHINLSIEVDDLCIHELVATGSSFKISGSRCGEVYSAELKLYGELKGQDLRKIKTDRRVELVIPKVISEWWPRLLHDKTKVAFVKVDFDKWIDEDEENEAESSFGDFNGTDFSQFSDNFQLGNGSNIEEDDEDICDLEDINSEEIGNDVKENETDKIDQQENLN